MEILTLLSYSIDCSKALLILVETVCYSLSEIARANKLVTFDYIYDCFYANKDVKLVYNPLINTRYFLLYLLWLEKKSVWNMKKVLVISFILKKRWKVAIFCAFNSVGVEFLCRRSYISSHAYKIRSGQLEITICITKVYISALKKNTMQSKCNA